MHTYAWIQFVPNKFYFKKSEEGGGKPTRYTIKLDCLFSGHRMLTWDWNNGKAGRKDAEPDYPKSRHGGRKQRPGTWCTVSLALYNDNYYAVETNV